MDASKDEDDEEPEFDSETEFESDVADASDEVESALEFPQPLPDDVMNRFERYSSWALAAVLGILLLGSLLLPSLFWDGFLEPVVWAPISKDAEQGDSGYNPINTLLFSVVLLLFVVALSARFRRWGLPADSHTIIALIPWVVLASVVRVLEDSEFFPSSYQMIFISPLIHFHLSLWVIVCAGLGYWATRLPDIENIDSAVAIRGRHRMVAVSLLLLMWVLFYVPAMADNSDIGILWSMPGLLASVMLACWFAGHQTEGWNGIERSLFAVGWGGVVMGLGLWMQFQSTPWHQGNESVLWPAFIILGVPTLICWQLYRMGSAADARMQATGYEAGVLPKGISLEEWEKGEPEMKSEFEADTRMALLANPLVLAFVFGQLCDGLATWMGIDYFGYSEKHVVSSQVITWGAALMGRGAWLFFVMKAALTVALIWVFTEVRVEYRQRHLRLLIVLALLVVGLAPGLRDLGRLLLGV